MRTPGRAGSTLAALVLAASAAHAADVVRWNPPHISSAQFESHPAFDPRTRDLWFVRSSPEFRGWRIFVSHCGGDGWSEPEASPVSGEGVEADPWFTSDGASVYFISSRKDDGVAGRGLDLWRADRDAAGRWEKPQRLPEPVNSSGNEWFPRVHGEWLYFGSDRPGGFGKTDLWRAHRDAGGAWSVENLGAALNTAGDEYEPQIYPDGKRIVFMADGGLFESRAQRGGWTPRTALKPPVYGNGSEIGVLLSPSGRSMLFARDTGPPDSGELFLLKDQRDRGWPPNCPR